MNNDGAKDIFISNGIKRDFRNNDFKLWHEKYHNETRDQALETGDLDKESYISEILYRLPPRKRPNYFFLNGPNLSFQKLDFFQPDTNSNGAAYADFDNDGDLDIVVNNSDDEAFVYRNNTTSGNFIKIKLKGSDKNLNAIGSRVEIITKEGRQINEQYFSRGFQSATATDLHFGLGAVDMIDTLKIYWPDGKFQFETNVPANQTFVIDYQPTGSITRTTQISQLFEDITEKAQVDFRHKENQYNDFENESLIPHKMSQLGPGLAVADINNDGLDDFYIGGSKGQIGALYIQLSDASFKPQLSASFASDSLHEDIDALFFDADNDGDLDLYVVSGSNEYPQGSDELSDRLYINDGNAGFIKSMEILPDTRFSGGDVKSFDFDQDGDNDLIITGRQIPGKYGFPTTTVLLENQLENGTLSFVDVTSDIAPGFVDIGMISSVICEDLNGDQWVDVVLAGEWTELMFFINQNGRFRKNNQLQLTGQSGWWFSLAANDFDQDGDVDLVAGNLGLNYKYKASLEAPFQLHTYDFDDNGSLDIVLSFQEGDKRYPLRGRECSSGQMPFIKEKFETYNNYATAQLVDVFGSENLSSALNLNAVYFASLYLENDGDGQFTPHQLPIEAQFSSINAIVSGDFTGDGLTDIVLAGNLYGAE